MYLNFLKNKIYPNFPHEQPRRFKMEVQNNDPVVEMKTFPQKVGLCLE